VAKGDKQDVSKAKAAVVKKKAVSKFFKEIDKRGIARAAGSTNSARQPSMPVKTNAKNKMKAQGAKIGSSATSGYGKKGKK
jgi:hypothetical protein